jgi:hypothetical protein
MGEEIRNIKFGMATMALSGQIMPFDGDEVY